MSGRAGAVATLPLASRLVVLGVAAAAVAAELIVPWEPPSDVAPAAAVAPVELRHAAPPPPAMHPAIGAHPLFYPSRQPWSAPVAAAPAVAVAPPAPPAYALSGVVLTDGERTAILKPANGTRAILLGEGGTVDGWTLRRVDAAGAHFAAGQQTFDLGFPKPVPGRR
jgi:hypothetical protein